MATKLGVPADLLDLLLAALVATAFLALEIAFLALGNRATVAPRAASAVRVPAYAPAHVTTFVEPVKAAYKPASSAPVMPLSADLVPVDGEYSARTLIGKPKALPMSTAKKKPKKAKVKAKRKPKPKVERKPKTVKVRRKRKRLKRISLVQEALRVLWVRQFERINKWRPTIPEVRRAFPCDGRAKTTAWRIGRKTKT